jgi:tRNA(Arg) A34 adenosine deaminase TadA
MNFDEKIMREAIALSAHGIHTKQGGPFGAIIVKNGEIIGRGFNQVTSTNDPTAHAEMVAIRDACKNIGDFSLEGATIYTSCEPCPMCFAAIYWARIQKVFYANTQADAEEIGFDDAFIYAEIAKKITERQIPFVQIERNEALAVFKAWSNDQNKTCY